MSALVMEGTVRWKPSRATLPQARLCTQAEAIALLKRQLFEDAIAAGWLKPCCVRQNKVDRPTKLYAVKDVQAVEEKVLAGEYPNVKRGGEA